MTESPNEVPTLKKNPYNYSRTIRRIMGTPNSDGKKPTEQEARDTIAAKLIKQRGDPTERLILEERRSYLKEARDLSFTDTLTQLRSRRFLLGDENKERNDPTRIIGELENTFKSAQRYNRELVLFMIDLDLFKDVNDRYGHEVGDQLLKIFADAAKKSFRQPDILTRYAGDEFCFILPEVNSKDNILELVKRFKQEYINLQRFFIKGLKIIKPYTLSIGISLLSSNKPKDHLELLKFADEALYLAKNQKDNAIIYGSVEFGSAKIK